MLQVETALFYTSNIDNKIIPEIQFKIILPMWKSQYSALNVH